MSTANGKHGPIIIGRRGMVEFQMDEKSAIVKVDVVAASNEWGKIDRAFRGADGFVPDEQMEEHQASAMRFAQAHLQNPDPPVNNAEAWAFIARITEEVDKLKDFLRVRERETPSSPEPSTILTTCD